VDVAGRLRRVADPLPGGTTYYDYDSLGGLNRIQDPIGAVSSGAYNLRGFRTQWSDADRGRWTFNGNSLNELVSWSDARGRAFSANHDALGRLTSRVEPDGTSTWTWGTSAAERNLGRLKSVAGYGYAESLAYDSLGRIANRSIATDQSYRYDYTYNTIGALDTVEYPTSPVPTGQAGARFKVRYAYSYGAPVGISDVTQLPGKPLWTLNSANDYSSATSEALGANVVGVASGYKAWSNELTSRQSGAIPTTSNRQNLVYQWDAAGNLAQRQDLNQSLLETFSYDALNRLQSSTLNGVGNLAVAYDASGNVTSRSDVGIYTYGDPAHPHAVTAAGSHTYTYDANGNQITRDGASQAWAAFNLPILLAQPIGGTTYQSQLTYGPTHQRWKQVASYANGTETTLYVGGLLEKESTTSTGKTYWRHYVPTPSGMTIVVSRNSDASTSTRYLLTDHIGSSDAVLGASGELVARESFAAFGARRGGNWSSGGTPDWAAIANTSRHGYTGHEHLDNLALIHMNGRVYDPTSGRFMSVDPIISDAADSQTLNPYAYVGNRPLSYTDPSGYDVVCGGVCTAVVISFAQSLGNYISGRGEKFVPPATALPGQSAQTGTSMCGPGQASAPCGGIVLAASASPAASGAPSSSWAATDRSGKSTSSGFSGEPGSQAAAAGMVLARDPNIPTEVKIAAPIVLAVGTGAALFCAESILICSLIANAAEFQAIAAGDGPAPVGGAVGRSVRSAANEGMEFVQRAMSRAELAATEATGLLRGGRAGTHYASDAVNTTALRARSRLALPQTPEVRATLEVSSGRFSPPSRVSPDFEMPGGGTQRTATGEIPVRILKVDEY
jgi:RHS repeat-associated protein